MKILSKDLNTHIAATYRALRFALVAIGFTLPLALWFGYYVLTQDPNLQGSLSAYYHAGNGATRDWFVGSLFATGALLFVYQGFTQLEDYALNLAGVLALLVALFPMEWPAGAQGDLFSTHGVCAVAFFICIGYVCTFQASATLTLIPDDTRRKGYSLIYKALGVAMVALPVFAFILFRKTRVFFIEAAGVYVFALYWLVKSREIRETQADQKAATGKLQAPVPDKLSDAFRQLKVTPVDKAN